MARRDAMYSASTPESILPPLRWVWDREMGVDNQPIVAQGRVIVPSGEQVVALDGQDGRVLWQTAIPEWKGRPSGGYGDSPYGWSRERFRQLSMVAIGNRLFVGGIAVLYAVDLRTGVIHWYRKLWELSTQEEAMKGGQWDEKKQDYVYDAPRGMYFGQGGFVTCFAGHLLVGTGTGLGKILCLDPTTGRTLWESAPLHPQLDRRKNVLISLLTPTVDRQGTLYFRSEWEVERPDLKSVETWWSIDGRTGKGLRRIQTHPVIACDGLLVERSGDIEHMVLTASARGGARALWKTALHSSGLQDTAWPGARADAHYGTYAARKGRIIAGEFVVLYPEKAHPMDVPGVRREVFALDTKNGKVLWQRRLAGADPSPSNVVLSGDIVYALDFLMKPALTALDARTGKWLWSSGLRHIKSFALTYGPVVSRGRIFVGWPERICALEGRKPEQDPDSIPPIEPGLRLKFVDKATGEPVGLETLSVVLPGAGPDSDEPPGLFGYLEDPMYPKDAIIPPPPPGAGLAILECTGSSGAFIENTTYLRRDRWALYVMLAPEFRARDPSGGDWIPVGTIEVPCDRVEVQVVRLKLKPVKAEERDSDERREELQTKTSGRKESGRRKGVALHE